MRNLSVLILVVLLTAACGKKGALIYPDMLVPAAPAYVTVRQVGPGVKLAFVLPDNNKAGQGLIGQAGLAGVKVLRRETIPGQDAGCSSCANDFRLFKTMYVDHVEASARLYGRQFMLMDNDVVVGREYAYKVIAFTKGNVDGEASKPVQAALVQAPLPPVLRAVSAPTEIRLEFVALPPHGGVLAGYNLYRWVKGEALPFLALNKEPLVHNSFTDTGLERGVTYMYAARMVVRFPKGDMVESVLSNDVEAGLRDDE